MPDMPRPGLREFVDVAIEKLRAKKEPITQQEDVILKTLETVLKLTAEGSVSDADQMKLNAALDQLKML